MQGRAFSRRCFCAFMDTLLLCGFDSIDASREWDALMDRT